MGGFWARIFGLDAPDWTAGGSWKLEWLARPGGDKALLLLAAGVAVAVLVWFMYRIEGRLLSRTWRFALAALRVAALAVGLAMLLEPVIVLSKEEQVPSHLIVLVDVSGSMGLQDAWRDEAEATRVAKHFTITDGSNGLRKLTRADMMRRVLDEETLKRLEGDGARIVHLHPFNDRLLEPLQDFAAQPVKTSGDSTALGAAIRQALATYSGSPLAGILVLSDGQSNTGEPPASAVQLAVETKLPIACIALGTPDGPRNAQITKIEVSPMVFVRDDNNLAIHIQSRGMQDLTSTLLVEKRLDGGPWQELSRESVILQLEGAVQTFTIPFREGKPGKVEFKATLSGAGPELTEDDNVAHAETQVIRQKLQALLIAGATFPEIQFLRNSLIRDRGIEVSSWLMAADKDYEHPADIPIQRLPITQEELDEYDCVILYDPDPAGFPPNFGDLLTNFVTKAGGGFVYIAGELQTSRIFDAQLDPALNWLQLLPVIREPGLFRSAVQTQLSSRQPWRLQMTEEGKHDPVLAFSDDTEANIRIIENLPGMFWHFPVTRAKPGATVLAVHGDPRMRNEYGPEVLIATQLVGPGRSMFIGFDSTYRWRFLDDQFFDGFWARVVDRAGRNKRLGGSYPFRLATPRSEYKPGANVKIIARFHNPDDVERTMTSLPGQVEHGDDEPQPISLVPEQEPGVFSGSFVPSKAGPHFVKVWMGDDAVTGGVKAATLPLDITLPNLEFENPVVDRAALDAVAICTGGKTFDVTQGKEAADLFKIGRVKHLLEHRHEIWDAPALWVSLFVILCLEWILRKRARLI